MKRDNVSPPRMSGDPLRCLAPVLPVLGAHLPLLVLPCVVAALFHLPIKVSHMKRCAEDVELKVQGSKQTVVYSGVKNIVKTSTGEWRSKWRLARPGVTFST